MFSLLLCCQIGQAWAWHSASVMMEDPTGRIGRKFPETLLPTMDDHNLEIRSPHIKGPVQRSADVKTTKMYTSFKQGTTFGLMREDGSYCLLADFEARIDARQIGNIIYEDVFYTPDITKLQVSGTCDESLKSMPEEGEAKLVISWQTTDGKFDQQRGKLAQEGTFVVEMVFLPIEKKNQITEVFEYWWKLADTKMSFTALEDSTEIYSGRMSRSSTGGKVDKSPTGINAPTTQTLYCRHSLNVTYQSEDNLTVFDATLQFKGNMNIQPFKVDRRGAFGTKYLCQRSRNINLLEQLKNQSTVATGVCLGIATVGLLIGYTIKKQFYPDKEVYDIIGRRS